MFNYVCTGVEGLLEKPQNAEKTTYLKIRPFIVDYAICDIRVHLTMLAFQAQNVGAT